MQDVIKLAKKDFKNLADTIPNWTNMSRTELANAYCDAFDNGNKELSEKYMACLMCTYFYMVGTLYKQSKSLNLDEADFIDWVYEGLQIGLKYRGWRDPSMKVSKNPNGAETVFNRCFFSVRQRNYEVANRDKRKINYNNVRLTSILDEYGDIKEDNILDKDDIYTTSKYDNCADVVQYCINKHQILNAIIIDGLAYKDIYKMNKSTNENRQLESNKRRLGEYLINLDTNFEQYFINKYDTKNINIMDTIEQVKVLKPGKLKKLINIALDSLKNDNEVRSLICC